MNELDSLINQFKQEDAAEPETLTQPKPVRNDLLDRYRQEDQVLNAFAAAHKTNPDEFARLKQKAVAAGMTPEQVDMFPEEAERRSRYDQAVRLAQDSPLTAKWLADQDNARIGHDNVDNLSGIEQAFSVLKNTGRAAVSGLRSASAGAVGLARAPFDLGAAVIDPLVGTILPENPLARGAQWLADYQQDIAGRAKAEMPRGDGNFESGYYSGIGSLARNLASLPMAFLPGGQKAALTTMVAPVFGEGYGEARDQGLSMPRSLSYAGSQAVVEYATEKLPLTKLLGDLKAGTPFLKTLAKNAALEVPGEQLATALQDLNEWAALPENQDKPFAEYLKERPDAAAQTLIATLVGTGGQVTVMEGIGKAVGYAEKRANKALQAEQDAAFLDNLNRLAAADKLLQRDPETFQSFVAAAAEDGPVDTVYLDGKMLMQSGMAPELAKVSPSIVEQLDRAILTGGDIAIPVEEYAARIAPTELAPQLLDHLKTEPEGFTRAEAQQFMADSASELQAEVERSIADSQNKDEFRASQERVRQTVLDNLNQVGRFSPQKNELDATLIAARSAVRAQQLGMTPEEFFTKQVVRVQGERAGGMQFDQGASPPDKTMRLADLPRDMREELFNEHATNSNQDATDREFYSKKVPSGLIDIKGIQVDEIPADQLQRYIDVKLSDMPPIVIADGRLIDGQHRIQAARAKGIRQLRYIDMTGLIDTDAGGYISEIPNDQNILYADRTGQKVALSPHGSGDNLTDLNPIQPENDGRITEQLLADAVAFVHEIEYLAEKHGKVFIRWSPTAERDLSGSQQSRDFVSGSTHTGLSAVEVDNKTHPVDIAKALSEYMFLRMQDRRSVPRVYAAERVGTDSDSHALIKPTEVLLETPKYVIDAIDKHFAEVMSLQDDIATAEKRLQRGAIDAIGKQIIEESIAKKNAALDKLYVTNQPQRTQGAGTFDPNDPNILHQSAFIFDQRWMDNDTTGLAERVKRVAYAEDDYRLPNLANAVPANMIPQQAKKDMVMIYRGVPTSVKGAKIRPGDWVAIDKKYASAHGTGETGKSAVIAVEVPAEDIVWAGTDMNEFFYVPRGMVNDGERAVDALNRLGAEAFGAIQGQYYQPDGDRPRGAFSPEANIITLLNNADLSTFLHESAHYFFENDIALASELVQKAYLTAGEQRILDDVSALLSWHGIQGDLNEQLRRWHTMDFEERRVYHERTAESFERYLLDGKAPSIELQSVFQTFRSWMLSVYKSLKDFLSRNPEAGKLSDEVRGVFDRMLATEEQIALAEQARSMMALFTEPLGMTPDEFAAYQAQGKDSTATAVDELQAKGLRDMQWLGNKRGKAIAKLQKEAKALRAEAMIEARRAVMSQPLYRAWDFLTRKLSDNDKLPPLERKSDPDVLDPTLDSLFVAIAKLGGIRKDQVLSEWGIDPKDTPQSGLFGKPVWRIKDGLTLDGMAEALAEHGYLPLDEHGYLPLDEHGKYELNDLGDRFLEELAGNTQYSHAYQPQDLLPGEQVNNPAGRLDLGALAAMGVPDEVVNAVKARRMTAKEGLHPDLVAELFGFSSGDELVRALAAAETPKAEIDALTDVRMLENYGELSSPEAIEKAADRAIHNDVRARMVATEANALAKAAGQRRVLAPAAREFARAMIDRLKVRAVKPGQYANAEVRAAKAAEKASKSGDIATAAAEKRNQLVNTYATRAAHDALDEVDAGLRYLKKFGKVSKTLDPDYQEQIDALLERFDLKPVSNRALDKRASLAKWIEAQREAGLEPDIPPELENEANRKSYKDMTVEDFRGLIDTVKQIEHLGRLKHKLLTAQDQRAFGVIVDEVAASIVENGGEARPVELETPTGIRPWLEGFAAGHRKLASLIRQMDGGQDNGPFWRVLVRGMNEAATDEAVMNERATVALAELYKPLLDMKGGLNGDKQFIPEINDSLTRGGRLAVALNWGNATNRARIMDGDGWSEAQVNAILRRLTRAEWEFVNSMWAYIDSYWPQIEAKEKRVTGRAPDKVRVEPFSFRMDNGETVELTGGYYPIKYDSNRDDRAEKLEAAEVAKDMMRGAFTRSTTRRGHTKERVEGVRRPVKKTLDVITQHVSEVTHDLAWHEWLIDANRLLNAKPINQAIRDHYGTEVIRTMKDALTGIATADIIPQTKIDTALLYLRANVSRSTMGVSLTTAFLQPFGLAQSMVRIGSRHVLRGMARWAGDAARFESSMTWIGEKSDFMRLRNKTFNRELHEIKGRVSKGHSKARTIYDASLFMLMQKMQMVADVPTWIGAYEKAMAENHDDATAVALADQAVLDSQGGGQTKDMAEFQRKHPFLTMFYSYFNTTLNLAAESTAQTDFKNPLALAGWASDMALLMVIPALAPAMLLALMRGEECGEPEECAKKLAQAQAGYLLGTMLGVRELSGSVAGYDYAGPPVGRVVSELGRFGTQVSQGEADEAAAMSAVSLLGVTLGIPTTQILRSWRGWNAWEEGDAPATSILLGPPPKD